MIDDSNLDEEEIKNNFFDAIKNENISDIVKFFRNEKLKVWLFREEDDYTGNYIFCIIFTKI
jgi:hypothetical protein